MTASPDANERQHKRKSNNRLEFSKNTKKDLAAAAGYKCAIRQCLTQSTCISKKTDGTVGSANFGRASHIYAASPNGPRPAPPGMTPEQIKHHSNGIWTCSACGDTIDKLECDYSPDQLVEMKKVREAATRLAASDPEIKHLSVYISPINFDNVLWDNLPSLDTTKIRLTLKEIAASEMHRSNERSKSNQSTPAHLPLKPLASAINKIIESGRDTPTSLLNGAAAHPSPNSSPSGNSHVLARHRAAEIIKAWAGRIPSHERSGACRYIHEANVLITARHPQTRVVCKSSIRMIGRGHGRHDRTADEGEILQLKLSATGSLLSIHTWKLDVDFNKGGVLITSALRLVGGWIFPHDLHNAKWEDNFDSYEQVVQKLAEGWQPIGFVYINIERGQIDDRLHPEAFEIELQSTASELDELLYRCSKIRLARSLERQWGWGRSFSCTDAYFERGLDLATIQAASDELRKRLGSPPYRHIGESPPLVRVGDFDIKLVVRGDVITFQKMRRS